MPRRQLEFGSPRTVVGRRTMAMVSPYRRPAFVSPYSLARRTASRVADRRSVGTQTPARRTVASSRPSYERVGRPFGTSTAKRVVVNDNWSDVSAVLTEATMRETQLTALAQTTTNAINARQRGMIDCIGFDLRLYLQNSSSSAMVFNMAVVAPRNQNSTIPDGFFRGYGADREQDFPAAATAESSLLNLTPLNADDMNILWRGQITLGPNFDATAASTNFDRSRPNYKVIKKWIPIYRQIRYDNTSAVSCEDPIFLCVWTCRPSKLNTDAPLPNNIIRQQCIMYFKEPKS